MILDDKEKERFITWLEITAESCRIIAEQFEKLPGPEPTTELIRREKQKAAACLIIAADLKNAESISIGDGD